MEDFNIDIHHLGSLCYRGHDYNNTGKSLRAKDKSNACIECRKITHRERYKENLEYYKKYAFERKEEFSKRNKIKYLENKEKFIKKNKEYYSLNREKILKRLEKYYKENSEIIKERVNNYQKNNRDKVNEIHRKRRLNNLDVRLSSSISNGIYRSLKNNKDYESWVNLVDFTLEEFKKHMESQFTEGMCWGLFGRGRGKIHIDHITPITWFNITSIDCEDFKKAWALSNLQPMWHEENSSKNNYYFGKYIKHKNDAS